MSKCLITNTCDVSTKRTQLKCTKMQFSPPASPVLHSALLSSPCLCRRVRKKSHRLTELLPVKYLALQDHCSVGSGHHLSLIPPGSQLSWFWGGASDHLWCELLSILPRAGHCPLSPGQVPSGRVPTTCLLPACGLLPACSPHSLFLEPRAASPSYRGCGVWVVGAAVIRTGLPVPRCP